MDCAENQGGVDSSGHSILSSYDNTITSMYFSHFIQGLELGAFFTKDKRMYEMALCVRNHGMTRHLDNNSALKKKFLQQNKTIDPNFLFAYLGNNYRPIELSALFARLDKKRWFEYTETRIKLFKLFYGLLNKELFYKTSDINEPHVPFALPLFAKSEDIYNKAKLICKENNVETRAFVGSNLLRQPAFRHLGDYRSFPVSELIHKQAFYIGLYSKLKEEQVIKLAGQLNKL